MAKVRLELETDLQPLASALGQGDALISETRASVQALGKDSKTAFGTASREAAKFSDVVKNGGQSIAAIGKTTSAYQHLITEIRVLTGESVKLRKQGDLIGAEKAIKQAGHLKEELVTVQKQIHAISNTAATNLAGGFRAATQVGLQGFEGIIAAQSLMSSKNEEFEKQLIKLQALRSLTSIAGEFGEIKNRLAEIKLAFGPVTTLYGKANEALKSWGKTGVETAVEVGAANKGFFANFSTNIKSFVSGGIASFKSLWATIAANPLGLLLTAIGALVTLFIVFREKIADLIGPFRAVLENIGLVADKQEKAAKKIIELTKLQEEVMTSRYDAEIAAAEAAGKRTEEIENEKTKALEKSVQKRIDKLTFLFGKNKGLQDDELKELQDVLKLQEKLQSDATVNRIKEQKKVLDFQKETQSKIDDLRIASIKDDQKREEEALAKKFLDEINATEDRLKLVFGSEAQRIAAETPIVKAAEEAYQRELAAVRKKYADKRLDQQKELLALQKQFEDDFRAIVSKRESGELENIFGEARIKKEAEISLREIAILKDNLIKRGQAINDFEAKMKGRKPTKFSLTTEQQEQFSILERQIFERETDALIQLTIDRENRIAEAKTQSAKQSQETLGTTEAALIASVEIAPKPEHQANENAVRAQQREVDFERAKQNAILNIQKEYAIKKLELQQATLKAEYLQQTRALEAELILLRDRNDEDANIRRANINETLALLDKKFDAENGKAQDETAKLINDLQSQQEVLNKKPPFDLAKLLGLKPEDIANLKTAFDEVSKIVEANLNDQLDKINKQISASQEREAQSQHEIESLNGKLDAEKDLAERGKANNASAIEAQIQQKQQAVAAEKTIQEKALEERKKIQKQQLTLDTIAQASNLALTASQLLTSARDPISLGIAIASVAAMIVGFIAAKAKAFQAVNSGGDTGAQGFSEGVIDLHGRGTETSDEIPANLSVGESVMTAKETRKHKKLFQGIRLGNDKLLLAGILKLISGRSGLQKGMREHIENKSERSREVRSIMERVSSPFRIERVLRELVRGTGVSIPNDLPAQLSAKRDAVQQQEFHSFINNDFASLQKEQRETNKRLDKLIESSKEKLFSDGNGNIISKKGTHTITKRRG